MRQQLFLGEPRSSGTSPEPSDFALFKDSDQTIYYQQLTTFKNNDFDVLCSHFLFEHNFAPLRPFSFLYIISALDYLSFRRSAKGEKRNSFVYFVAQSLGPTPALLSLRVKSRQNNEVNFDPLSPQPQAAGLRLGNEICWRGMETFFLLHFSQSVYYTYCVSSGVVASQNICFLVMADRLI